MWTFVKDKSVTLASYVVSVPHRHRASTSPCTEFSFTPPFTTSSRCWTRSLGVCPAISFDHIQPLEHITSASHQPKVAVALRISSLIGTYCHSEYLLCNRLNVGLPILHKSRQGSALWKWLRKIPEALRPQVAAPPIPLLPGCYDNQSDMQIETPCVVTMGMCSTEWHKDTDSLMRGRDTKDLWSTCSHICWIVFHSHSLQLNQQEGWLLFKFRPPLESECTAFARVNVRV